jgi:hypothetical protein
MRGLKDMLSTETDPGMISLLCAIAPVLLVN